MWVHLQTKAGGIALTAAMTIVRMSGRWGRLGDAGRGASAAQAAAG